MPFHERLRALRRARGISQSELAREISVSRSAVAKWENGLGLPGEASYEMLLRYFAVAEEELPLGARESERVTRRRLLRSVLLTLLSSLLLVLTVALPLLLLHLHDEGYGFTSLSAAGELWEDNPVIHTPEYDFYYYPWNDGPESDRAILGYIAVEKLWLGYRRIGRGEEPRQVCDETGERQGLLYTYEGEHTDYHIYMSVIVGVSLPREFFPPYTLVLDGKERDMIENSFFETDHGREITELWINGRRLTVGEK